jgi:hypothetical protein
MTMLTARKFLTDLNQSFNGTFSAGSTTGLVGKRATSIFHGWPNDKDRKGCFVFKWKQAGTYHRIYGFLFNPRATDHGFQACILVSHAKKNTAHTDPSELEIVLKLKTNPQVIAAVKKAFEPKAR